MNDNAKDRRREMEVDCQKVLNLDVKEYNNYLKVNWDILKMHIVKPRAIIEI